MVIAAASDQPTDPVKLLGLLNGKENLSENDSDSNLNEPAANRKRRFPVLGDAALIGLAGDVVRAIDPHTEANIAGVLVTFLAMFGNAVGRSPHVKIGAARHGCNEFAVLVGDTAKARKGTTQAEVDALMTRADFTWTSERRAGGLSSGEGLLWHIRDRHDATGDEGVYDKRLMVIEEEFSSMLKQTERQGNTISETVRRLWDANGKVQTLTKNSPSCSTEPHVSIIGHITAAELTKRLSDTDTANGLANRFLFVAVQRSKLLPHPQSMDAQIAATLSNRIFSGLESAQRTAEMHFNQAARIRWEDIYPELSHARPGIVGNLVARSEAHTRRLATIYALLDSSGGIIDVCHLDAALAVWRYCEASVTHIFGDATGDKVADRILDALRGEGALSREAIVNVLQRNVPAVRIDAALELLSELQLVESHPDPTFVHGLSGVRQSTIWKIR